MSNVFEIPISLSNIAVDKARPTREVLFQSVSITNPPSINNPNDLWISWLPGPLAVFNYGSPPGTGTNPFVVRCGGDEGEIVYTVTTINATPTVIWSATITDQTVVAIRASVSGQKSGGGDQATYQIIGSAYRNGGGATLIGTTVVIDQQESNLSWDAYFDVSGNLVRLMVVGVVTTINWSAAVSPTSAG